MSVLDLVRPDLRALAPYAAAEQVGETIRLNANESPYACASGTRNRPLNRYPEIRPRDLTALLESRYGCAPGRLLVTRGSSEAIDLVMRVFCRAGIDNVVIPTPAFSMYEHYATVQGARTIKVALDAADDFHFDADRVIAACDEFSKLVFICTPNNPTGATTSLDEIRAVATARRNRSVIVVDEAYIEYAATGSAIKLLDAFDNVVVLRTLSKAYGLAGARCGVLIAQEPLVNQIDAVQAPYSLATPVVDAVLQELRDNASEPSELNIRTIVYERERLARQLESLPVVQRVYPSDANFLLARLVDSTSVVQACRSSGILIRELGNELGDCVRITIGTPDENDRLLTVLAEPTEACA